MAEMSILGDAHGDTLRMAASRSQKLKESVLGRLVEMSGFDSKTPLIYFSA